MDERAKIIDRIANKWSDLLGIERKKFITRTMSGTGHHIIGFNDSDVCNQLFGDFSTHVKEIGMVMMDVEGIPLQYLEKDLDEWFLKKSLYLYAWTKRELFLLNSITAEGDYLYVKLSPYFYPEKFNLYKLLEKWKKSDEKGIYKINKKSLLAHYMFVNNRG